MKSYAHVSSPHASRENTFFRVDFSADVLKKPQQLILLVVFAHISHNRGVGITLRLALFVTRGD